MKRFALAAGAALALGMAPAAVATGTLSGKWRTTISGTKQLGGALNGTWVIRFAAGTFQTFDNGRPVTRGMNAFKGNVITFIDSPGPYECATKGEYKFTLKGKRLRFKRVHDSQSGICIARVIILSHAFTKA
jgi:hypothetical protein